MGRIYIVDKVITRVGSRAVIVYNGGYDLLKGWAIQMVCMVVLK